VAALTPTRRPQLQQVTNGCSHTYKEAAAIEEEAASYSNQNRPLPQQDNKGRSHRNYQEAADLERDSTLAQEE
jgi:hypothetical protein